MRISIIIPTYNPGADVVVKLEARLRSQRLRPSEIIVIDSTSTDGSFDAWSDHVIRMRIPTSEFNHGGTRNLGAARADGEILVFLTQDAMPADETWLERLIQPLQKAQASAAYSRQIPRKDASPSERYARSVNYPETPHLRCPDDAAMTGVRRHFLSNVSSAILVQDFRELGGFSEGVIMNEDMTFAARLLEAGKCIAYAAESVVVHSHDYDLSAQFRRYFDIGVAVAQDVEGLASSGTQREGLRFVLGQLRYLAANGHAATVPTAVIEAAAKYLGYRLGTKERHLPRLLKRRLSMHAAFWDRDDD